MKQALILLVEGKGAAADSLSPALQKANYLLHVVHTGTAAFNWIEDNNPDIIIFDASAMRSSGTRTCNRLCNKLPNTPLIHCRAANIPQDEALAADVFLQKPFTPRKILNRVHALLPADSDKEEVVRCGHIILYRIKRSIDVGGQGERSLTPKLVLLFEEFLRHPCQIISRPQLMKNVWHTDYIGDTRTLDVHIRWIREYIEENPAKPKLLLTKRGQGYIFNVRGRHS